MKLFWSSRSPFVRKVMVFAHEVGVADRIEPEPVTVTGAPPHPAVLPHNPFAKIPTLVLDDGRAFYDSSVICAYLDTIHSSAPHIPADASARVEMMQRQSFGDGLMEIGLLWLGEKFRQQPGQSEKRVDSYRVKIAETLDRIEADPRWLDGEPVTVAQASLASALAYLDFRFSETLWRDGHPKLADWFARFSTRPSMVATQFIDDVGLGKQLADMPTKT